MSENGNRMIVGAPFEDGDATSTCTVDPCTTTNNNALNAGAAYVYTRSGTAWSFNAYVKASNAEAGDGFGDAVAQSDDGSTFAVGAPFEDSATTTMINSSTLPTPTGDDDSALSSGAVYVFTGTTQQAYVKPFNTGAGDEFGSSVSMSQVGNQLVVGAQLEDGDAKGVGGSDNNNATDSGAVYSFTRSGSTWSQGAYIKSSNTPTNAESGAAATGQDQFGFSVSIADAESSSTPNKTLVVGAPFEDSGIGGVKPGTTTSFDNNASSAGAAYSY
jgi:hypothetical protein